MPVGLTDPPVGLLDPACPIDWSHPLNRNLIDEWAVPPNSGWRYGNTLRDLVRGGRRPSDGTLTNAPTWIGSPNTNGGYGALKFTSNQYVDCGNGGILATLSSGFSVSAWIRWDTVASSFPVSNVTVASVDGGYELGFLEGTGFIFASFGSSVDFAALGTTPTAGIWYHLVGVHSSPTMQLYLNGILVAGSSASPAGTVHPNLRLGQRERASTDFLGALGGVSIFNRPFTAPDVMAFYSETRQGNSSRWRWATKRAYWSTQEGASTFPISTSDSLGTSDVVSRTSVGNRLYSDLMGLQDACSRTSNGNRLYADNIGLSDAFARMANGNRSLSDLLGLSDAFSRQSSGNRNYSEALGLSDAFARRSDANRALSDLLGLSDAFSRRSNANRSYSDNLGFIDFPTLVLVPFGSLIIAVIDNLGLSDAFVRRADANRALSDVLGLLDVFSRRAAYNRSYSDLLGMLDAVSFGSTIVPPIWDMAIALTFVQELLVAVQFTQDFAVKEGE